MSVLAQLEISSWFVEALVEHSVMLLFFLFELELDVFPYLQVRVFLLAEREIQSEVEAASDFDTKIAVFDRIIKDCVDVLQVIKEELKADPVSCLHFAPCCLYG